jgi:hypothetical protein
MVSLFIRSHRDDRPIRTVLWLLCSTVIMPIAIRPTAAAVIWNESVDGPLSTNAASPTPLSVGVGSNSIIATIGGTNRDYFSFTLAPGQSLESFLLASYASSDPVSWIGLQAGASWTAGDNVGLMIAQQHFGTADVGTNLLGITPAAPLAAGTYTVRAQQLGAITSYQLDLAVVPEPTSTRLALASAVVGAAVAASRRRSRSTGRKVDPRTDRHYDQLQSLCNMAPESAPWCPTARLSG